MHGLHPLRHFLPASRYNPLNVQFLAGGETVAAVLVDAGDWDTTGFWGEEVCTAPRK